MRRTKPLVALGIGLALACKTSPSADVARQPVSAAQPAKPQTSARREFETRILGRTVGDAVAEREVLADGSERWTLRTQMTLVLDDPGENASKITSTDVTEYGPDRAFVRSRKISQENGIEETEELERVGDRLVLRTSSPDHRDQAEFDIPSGYRSELQVLAECLRQAKAGATLPLEAKYVSFDEAGRRFGTESITVRGRVRETENGRSFEAWHIETRDIDGEITQGVVDDTGLPVRLTFGVFAMVPKGEASDTGSAARLSSYLPVEGNVGDADTLGLRVFVDNDDPAAPPAIASNAYQTVERTKDGYRLELHAMRLPPDARVPRLPMRAPADVQAFLRPTPASQSDAPEIVELAAKLRAGRNDADAVARDIVTWVFQNLGKRDGTRGAATATEALAAGHGDCTEHAALAVAMLRAAGIPARNADGIVLVPGWFTADAGYHAWPEVWLGRWVVLDPALGRLDVAAHYILFGYDEPGVANGSRAMGRLIGRTRIATDR